MKTDGNHIRSILGMNRQFGKRDMSQFEAFDITDEELACISDYPELFDAHV